ncbi:hypothetical protein B296_00050687 [Ensete ventricosum]|uniref:Uncharacterized protein n=1 Tax=Ensete ventricosum TaxID=4639 RepID=A0A426YJZ2_ENSVE|nr:hypothetical protein B296_00050687 [Ensete ventricosum]
MLPCVVVGWACCRRVVAVGDGRGDDDGRGGDSGWVVLTAEEEDDSDREGAPLGQRWQREIIAVEAGSIVQATMLAAAEGEKGDGGSGRSDNGGFWGRTPRDSFVVVLVFSTKVVTAVGWQHDQGLRPRWLDCTKMAARSLEERLQRRYVESQWECRGSLL